MQNLFFPSHPLSYPREALAILDRQTPPRAPHIEGLECYVQCRRAPRPGGDFFDFIAPNPGELILGIGHLPVNGLAGPILLTGLQTTLRALAASRAELPEIMDQLNRTLWQIAADNTYASLFAARIDPRKPELQYINAGHEAALRLRSEGGIDRIEPHAAVLGLSLRSVYRVRTIKFEPGDTLVALTEGSESGASSVLRSGVPVPFRDLPAIIVNTAESIDSTKQIDRTVVVIRRNHPGRQFAPLPPRMPRRHLAAAA